MSSRAAAIACRSRTRSTRSCAPSPPSGARPLILSPRRRRCRRRARRRPLPRRRHARRARLPRARGAGGRQRRGRRPGVREGRQASPDKDPKTARMWAAAGNMWIAADQPGKAALDLDKALALPGLEAEQRGEALLDRARAAERRRPQDRAGQAQRGRADHRRRPVLLVFLRGAGDPRGRRGDRAVGDRQGADACAVRPHHPVRGRPRRRLHRRRRRRAHIGSAPRPRPQRPGRQGRRQALEMLGVTPTVKMEPQPPK